MSNLVFDLDDYTGLGIKLTREPYYDVRTLEALSGKEIRTSWWGSPRERIKLMCDSLRTDANSVDELQRLVGFFHSHFGSLDSFLLRDPYDCAVINMGFGEGDGTTVGFQLQRTRVTHVRDEIGLWDEPTTPWRNRVADSFLTAPGSYVLECMTDEGKTDPPYFILYGSSAPGARRFERDATAGIPAINVLTSPNVTGPCTLSVWARTSAASLSMTLSAPGYGDSISVALTPTWQRLTLVSTQRTSSTAYAIKLSGNISMPTTDVTIDLWGAQETPLQVESRFVPTYGTVSDRQPAYWPEIASGFTPVWEPNGEVRVYIDSVEATRADSPTTASEYRIDSPGVVTFGAAPADGVALTWSGEAWQRVRFADAALPLERVLIDMWRGGIDLISVKP